MRSLLLFSINRGSLVILVVWAKVGGLIAAVTVTAAAQLWEFDYPRARLLNIGLQSGLAALNLELWASCARAILPRKQDAALRTEVLLAIALLPVLYFAGTTVSLVLPDVGELMECARTDAPAVCTAKQPSASSER